MAQRRASKQARAKKKPSRAVARKRKARPEPCDEPADAARNAEDALRLWQLSEEWVDARL